MPGADCSGRVALSRSTVRRQLVERAGLRGLPLLVPAPDLPGQEALRAAELAQPDRGRVDLVQLDEGVHEQLAAARGGGRVDVAQQGRLVEHDAVDEAHQVERRAQHGRVLHSATASATGTSVPVQRADHRVLADHVVRGGQHVRERRAAQRPGGRAVGDPVGQVRLAAGDDLAGRARRAAGPDARRRARPRGPRSRHRADRSPCPDSRDRPVGRSRCSALSQRRSRRQPTGSGVRVRLGSGRPRDGSTRSSLATPAGRYQFHDPNSETSDGHQQRAHDRGVEQDADAEPGGQRLEVGARAGGERGEGQEQDQRRAGDQPAGAARRPRSPPRRWSGRRRTPRAPATG